jgi:hypothetical protein
MIIKTHTTLHTTEKKREMQKEDERNLLAKEPFSLSFSIMKLKSIPKQYKYIMKSVE